DTEIVAHLIHRELERDQGVRLFVAVQRSLPHVVGAYAIAVVSRGEPGVGVVGRDWAPLVVGVGPGERVCGGGSPPLLAHTRDMVFLEDGDVAELRAGSFKVETVGGESALRASKRIDWSVTQAERGGYKHFMLKEIHEQPDVVEATLRGRIDLQSG